MAGRTGRQAERGTEKIRKRVRSKQSRKEMETTSGVASQTTFTHKLANRESTVLHLEAVGQKHVELGEIFGRHAEQRHDEFGAGDANRRLVVVDGQFGGLYQVALHVSAKRAKGAKMTAVGIMRRAWVVGKHRDGNFRHETRLGYMQSESVESRKQKTESREIVEKRAESRNQTNRE